MEGNISLTPIQPGRTNTPYIFDRMYEIVAGAMDWEELPEDSEERLLETLLSEDVSSSVILTVDSEELEIIYLQTTAMKKPMLKFPEVVLMHSTYRCNNHDMPLRSIMVMDANGQF